MNTKDLMIHVERIVRPVRADASKLRMRRELLAHLQAAYEEERARGSDEPAALAQAKRRLGDPAEITRQLQASVSRIERLSVTPFPRWFGAIVVAAAVLLPILIAIMPSPAWLTGFHAERASAGVTEMVSRHERFALAGTTLALELYGFLSYLCIVKAFNIANGVARRGGSRIALFGVLVMATQQLWIALICLTLTGRLPPGIDGGTLVVTGLLVSVGILVSRIQLSVQEWLSLDIRSVVDGDDIHVEIE